MPDDSAEPLSDDAYLERIDDRINWRLTHCNLPVADLKYLVNTVRALTERAERAEAEVTKMANEVYLAVKQAREEAEARLTARVTELEEEVEWWKDDFATAEHRVTELEAEREKLLDDYAKHTGLIALSGQHGCAGPLHCASCIAKNALAGDGAALSDKEDPTK